MINLKNIKIQVIIFLSALALYLCFRDKDLSFLLTTLIAVISAMAIDSGALFLEKKRISINDSSIISGLIIGFVLSPDNPWWVFLSASFLAICSKHLIHFHSNKKHLFNPAAFGIFMTIVFFGAFTQWKGAYMWYILAPFGIYFVSRIRKFELLIGYGTTAITLFGIQAFLQKMPLLGIFGYLSYFYIFVMLVEPKTTPIKPQGKFIFGMLAAALIFILTQIGVRFDAELSSLLVLNLFVPLLNKIP